MAIYSFEKGCVVRIATLMAKPVESWTVSKMIEYFLEAQWVPLCTPGMSELFPGQAWPNRVAYAPTVLVFKHLWECVCCLAFNYMFRYLPTPWQ